MMAITERKYSLTLLLRRFLSYRNQCIDLLHKDWFLYDRGLPHKSVKLCVRRFWETNGNSFTWLN